MHRHQFRSVVVAAVAAAALVACGEEEIAAPGTAPPTASTDPTTAPSEPSEPTTSVPVDAYGHPTDADSAVISIGYEGGFVPTDIAFTNPPALIVSGDGRAIVQGAVPMIFPGPLLPALFERSITEDGIQALLRLADDHGLLADIEYSDNEMIADAPFTVVRITVDGVTYEHSAYALGFDDAGDEARRNLADFVAAASDLEQAAGAEELGAEAPIDPDAYLVRATRARRPAAADADVEPVFVEWPAEVGVALADIGECAVVPADDIGSLFEEATQVTYFVEGRRTYQVAAIAQLPGRDCG